MPVLGSIFLRENTIGRAPATAGGPTGAQNGILQANRAILGIDEVGRGPWAGPLVIGAVILPKENQDWQNDLTDSKKLTAKKREQLAEIILRESPATALGWVSARELDATGLSDSLKLATRRAVRQIKGTSTPFSEIIIDGTINFLSGTTLEKYVTTLKKADFLIKEVSAASIIAKVARDNYMKELAKIYPEYGFEKHVGYGTALHKAALEKYGPTPEHRTSFKPVGKLAKNTTKIGNKAEQIVADYLESAGHIILARNHKTPFYEIDVISQKADKIYFTEVKYRKTNRSGSPLESITEKKQQQMHFAAESFLRYTKTSLQPILAAAAVSGENYHLDCWISIE